MGFAMHQPCCLPPLHQMAQQRRFARAAHSLTPHKTIQRFGGTVLTAVPFIIGGFSFWRGEICDRQLHSPVLVNHWQQPIL